MKAFTFSPITAIPFRFAFRRVVVLALLALAATLGAATARAQNTQVTIEGIITDAASMPGITVGDKYTMVVYYDPSQAPAVKNPGISFYESFTLSAVVFDTNGNQTFSNETGESLAVENDNSFSTASCCDTSTGAGFGLTDTTKNIFANDLLPKSLVLADFTNTGALFGTAGSGSITSIKVVNTGGIIPAFITAGAPDPNGKVPSLNGVSGSGVTNLDISFPLTLLSHGSSYVYTIALQDINFTGTCQASFTLTQVQFNTTVTLDSAKDDTFSCGPGTIWYWTFSGKTIPDFPGPATLTGTVTYGSTKAMTVTTVIIQ
jgi:hypothetical protein